MPLPYEKPATFLQWLDNLGHHTLRLGRQVRRFLIQVLRLLFWSVRQAFLLVWQSFLLLRAGVGRARRRQSGRTRLYLLDPSYEHNLGHYRTVAQYLATVCSQRDWQFIHLTGWDDLAFSSRIPIFFAPACPLIRAITPELRRELKKSAPARATAKALASFCRRLRLVLVLDRWFATPSPSYFYCHTGDLLYLWAFLKSPALGPRQHLFFMQFYLPVHFEQPRECLRFQRHARLLARRLENHPDCRPRLHLYSDSPRLLDSLVPHLGSWPRLLGHPLLNCAALDSLPTPASLANRPHPCGYFGYFSAKHGWPIIHRLLKAQAGKNTRWLLGINVKHPERATLLTIQASAAAANATMRLGYLPEDEYAAALDRCSTVLLPYSPSHYAMVSSAKAIDALAHGCFPIVPANTWLADIVRRAGYGLIVENGRWLDVPAAVAKLDLPSLWSERRSAVFALIQQFTAAHFLDALEQSSPPAAPPKN